MWSSQSDGHTANHTNTAWQLEVTQRLCPGRVATFFFSSRVLHDGANPRRVRRGEGPWLIAPGLELLAT